MKAVLQITILRSTYFSANVRLGTVAEIGRLRDLIEKRFRGSSLIIDRILFSGSHSGDSIGLHEIPRLKIELAQLKLQQEQEFSLFVEAMEALVIAAETEQNPIVFV